MIFARNLTMSRFRRPLITLKGSSSSCTQTTRFSLKSFSPTNRNHSCKVVKLSVNNNLTTLQSRGGDETPRRRPVTHPQRMPTKDRHSERQRLLTASNHDKEHSTIPFQIHTSSGKKALGHVKHSRRWSFRQGPTPHRDNDRRHDNDHKATSQIALAPGLCLVGATVRLPAEVSFFLFLEVGEGWRRIVVSLLVNV